MISQANLDQVVAIIRKQNIVTSPVIGDGGEDSASYAAFERLEQVASEAMLKKFVNDRSPALRVYAFYALADRPGPVPFDVLWSRLGDVASVKTMIGCVVSQKVVRDLMLERVAARLSTAQRTQILERLPAPAR